MSKVSDVFGVSPKTVLNKPYLCVQDVVATGVTPADITTGENQRLLNTVQHNDISGASLFGNLVSLPAGTYYLKTHSTAKVGSVAATPYFCRQLVRSEAGDLLLSGSFHSLGINSGTPYEVQLVPETSGMFTLTEATNIKIITYTNNSSFAGGTSTSQTPPNIVTEVQIWQLDAEVRTPVATSSQSYNGQDYLTGGITGLNVVRTGANTISVTAGACMDSTNAVALGILADETGVAVPTAINEIYNVFLTDDPVEPVRVDTDVDGSNVLADPDVDYVRWIGFVRNNSSGDITLFLMNGDMVSFGRAVDSSFATATNSYAQYDHSSVIPPSRIKEILYGTGASASADLMTSLDGTYLEATPARSLATAPGDTSQDAWGDSPNQGPFLPFSQSRYLKLANGVSLRVKAVVLKR